MPLKIYLIILRSGVYLSFISVFLVFSNLLFPFITSKQIFFNILIEVLAVFWLALVIKYPAVRPKKSLITYGLAAFFAALLVSSIFSVDFNLSFWGDIERMLGWFHIAHFFLFYLIIITVFRQWRDWRNLFMVSLVASFLVCLYAIFKVPMSTIGNTAYVSGYAIFNLYFALILFFRRREAVKDKSEFWLVGAWYLIAVLIMLSVMKFTHTRGAYVGLGVSFLVFFILYALYNSSKKIKFYSLAALAAAVIAVALVFLFPQSALVNNSEILRTITQINSEAVTFQTRLISWKAALKDFPSHAFLGTGYGNYALTFDKYFDPSFYNYTASETYFDRAHNNLVDLASTAGLLGILTYLLVLAVVVYYLFRGKRQGKISVNEFIVLLCLFVAYFIQNLAVFDSLVTYLSLMLILGYVYWLINGRETEELAVSQTLTNQELAVLAVAGLIFLSIIYQYNIKVFNMLDGTIRGQAQLARGDIAAGVGEYKKALSLATPLDRDSRASLINAVNIRAGALEALDKAKAKEIADYTVGLAEANVKLNPLDSMMQMQLAQILNTAAMVNQDNQSKFLFYSNRALEAIDKSVKASPGRITIYFFKAQLYITRNDQDNALKTLEYAYGLNKKYSASACYLAKAAIYFREEKRGYEALNNCLDLGGADNLDPVDFVKAALNYYTEKKDEPRLLPLYERWTKLEPSNPKTWVNLSLLYANKGAKPQAIAAAEKAAELDSSLKSAAEEFVKKLKSQ